MTIKESVEVLKGIHNDFEVNINLIPHKLEALTLAISVMEKLPELQQIVIEDVPHKYQSRLLALIKGLVEGEKQSKKRGR